MEDLGLLVTVPREFFSVLKVDKDKQMQCTVFAFDIHNTFYSDGVSNHFDAEPPMGGRSEISKRCTLSIIYGDNESNILIKFANSRIY